MFKGFRFATGDGGPLRSPAAMYRMHRVFCATPWELEGERRAFHDLIGPVNETSAMPRGALYVPVSLANIHDKRPHQYTIDENIRDCSYYLLALSDTWGPPERNFERDYQLALACRTDPALPMRECALLVRTARSGDAPPAPFASATATFATLDEFKHSVRTLLSRWIETS